MTERKILLTTLPATTNIPLSVSTAHETDRINSITLVRLMQKFEIKRLFLHETFVKSNFIISPYN